MSSKKTLQNVETHGCIIQYPIDVVSATVTRWLDKFLVLGHLNY